MTAFIIADIEVTDVAKYKEYIELITPSVLALGGQYLVRGGSPQTLDGDWHSSRIVLIEFPSREIAIGWLNDESIKDIHDMRRNNSSLCNMIVCDKHQ
jgi:uncharacterized protein (DUF1330 family)